MARMARTARIVLRPGVGPETSVEVDGQELKYTARAVTVRGDVDSFPSVDVDLYIETVEVDVEGDITVSDADHAFLVGIGWTPPDACRCPLCAPDPLAAHNPETSA